MNFICTYWITLIHSLEAVNSIEFANYPNYSPLLQSTQTPNYFKATCLSPYTFIQIHQEEMTLLD